MFNKYQVSLILKLASGHYFVQVRESIKDAHFRFPGTLSLFGGKVREGETARQAFLREMNEEIRGLEIEKISFEHRVYRWRRDLEKVDREINNAFEGNFNNFRGFGYDELVPQEALGQDRGNILTFREFIYAVDEDHYFIAEVSPSLIDSFEIREGKGVLITNEMCQYGLFYPTDKLALMHDIAKNKCKA